MLVKGNPTGIKTITSQRFLDALIEKGYISSRVRSISFLLAEEHGRVFTDSELDNLIRRAYQVYNPKGTAIELAKIINLSKKD